MLLNNNNLLKNICFFAPEASGGPEQQPVKRGTPEKRSADYTQQVNRDALKTRCLDMINELKQQAEKESDSQKKDNMETRIGTLQGQLAQVKLAEHDQLTGLNESISTPELASQDLKRSLDRVLNYSRKAVPDQIIHTPELRIVGNRPTPTTAQASVEAIDPGTPGEPVKPARTVEAAATRREVASVIPVDVMRAARDHYANGENPREVPFVVTRGNDRWEAKLTNPKAEQSRIVYRKLV